jgi:poly(3-hydroxybutyrate) depolymerase
MKKKTNLLFLFFSICQISIAQIGINSNGATPHSSSMLDVNSTNKGLLIPRVSLQSITDITTIANPALSLMVFNTNTILPEGSGYYGWNGEMWVLIKSLSSAPVLGKNQFFIPVDGDPREFWVHVPIGYDPATPTPMVIMLHGTSGNGGEFYERSGWKEVGNEENIITVFPSSWHYRITKPDGTTPHTTKWNTPPDAEWTFFPNETPRNDIKFLRMMIAALKLKLNIDNHRIYLEGFSNGGQMASKCGIEMNDVLAAVCSNAGSFTLTNVTYLPVRKLPVLYQVGNEDYGPSNIGPTIPLPTFEFTLNNFTQPSPARHNYEVSQAHIRHYNLNLVYGPIQIVMSNDNSHEIYRQVDYVGLSGEPNNVYRHIFVAGLGHKFPNENNFSYYDAPREHWKWMKQYTLP